MQLSRRNFSDDSLAVMDQVAILHFLSEQVLGLGRTFANNDDIDEATPDAREIVQFAKSVSVGLIEAIYCTRKKRRRSLAATYDLARAGITSVVESAQRLAAMEKRDTNGNGTVISNAVLPNLEQLRHVWVG